MPTSDVLERHVAFFGSGDLDGFLSQYADDAVFHSPEGMLQGKTQLREAFTASFAEFGHPDTEFDMLAYRTSEGVAYIAWTAKTPQRTYQIGSDTLVIVDDKIVAHTFTAHVAD